ncbi:MAG: hypothetical protein KAH23_02680 [Kiritimatiellae bacterium]|nr:hypothetical protein [Kiritimatiellia bacterium]
MLTGKRIPRLVLLPLFILSCTCVQARAKAKKISVLLVPNRYAIVQLGFGVAQMRQMQLMTYEKRVNTENLLMYAWNAGKHEWDKTDSKEYSSGALMMTHVERIILVGKEGSLPAELLEAPVWCPDVKTIETLDIVKIINSLNDVLKFKMHEWRWFAKRYGLTLKDLNKDRRRYGRYGKPGEKRIKPVPSVEKADDLPPARTEKAPAIDLFEKGVPPEERIEKSTEKSIPQESKDMKTVPAEEKLPEDK